jgi:hypothetical protein
VEAASASSTSGGGAMLNGLSVMRRVKRAQGDADNASQWSNTSSELPPRRSHDLRSRRWSLVARTSRSRGACRAASARRNALGTRPRDRRRTRSPFRSLRTPATQRTKIPWHAHSDQASAPPVRAFPRVLSATISSLATPPLQLTPHRCFQTAVVASWRQSWSSSPLHQRRWGAAERPVR